MELNRYRKKLIGAVPFHVWSKTFSCIELFSILPLMVVILAFFLMYWERISFIPYMSYPYRSYKDFNIYKVFYI